MVACFLYVLFYKSAGSSRNLRYFYALNPVAEKKEKILEWEKVEAEKTEKGKTENRKAEKEKPEKEKVKKENEKTETENEENSNAN